jgi:ATPase subunit of ABC transporter with duplicated ATPase domains
MGSSRGSIRGISARRACWPGALLPTSSGGRSARCRRGERARLGLLALRLTAPNLYLLDEPTNHLDIPGQEQLEAEILAHDASAILVTHDRRFARAVGTRFLAIARGRLSEVDPDDPAWLG